MNKSVILLFCYSLSGTVYVVIGCHNMNREQFWIDVFNRCGVSPSNQLKKKLSNDLKTHKCKSEYQQTVQAKKKRRAVVHANMTDQMRKQAEAERKGETYESGIGANMLLDTDSSNKNKSNKKQYTGVCKWLGCNGNHKDARSSDCKYYRVGKKLRDEQIAKLRLATTQQPSNHSISKNTQDTQNSNLDTSDANENGNMQADVNDYSIITEVNALSDVISQYIDDDEHHYISASKLDEHDVNDQSGNQNKKTDTKNTLFESPQSREKESSKQQIQTDKEKTSIS